MVRCCIPLCPLRLKNVGLYKGISYHEFPSDCELRQRWLANISRQDWIPGDRSRVCNRHFKEEDFVTGLKIRKLKKDAVPSMFEEHASYPQAAVAKITQLRKPSRKRQRNMPHSVDKPKREKCTEEFVAQEDSATEPVPIYDSSPSSRPNVDKPKRENWAKKLHAIQLDEARETSLAVPLHGSADSSATNKLLPVQIPNSGGTQSAQVLESNSSTTNELLLMCLPNNVEILPTQILELDPSANNRPMPMRGKSVKKGMKTLQARQLAETKEDLAAKPIHGSAPCRPNVHVRKRCKRENWTKKLQAIRLAEVRQSSLAEPIHESDTSTTNKLFPPNVPLLLHEATPRLISNTGNEKISPINSIENMENAHPVIMTKRGRPVTNTPEELKRKHLQLQTALRRMTSRLKEARENLQNMKNALNEVETPLKKNIDLIAKDAARGNISAIFLIDQVNNYKLEMPRWTQETLGHCLLWRSKSTKGYEYPRQKNLQKLPSRSTLQRFASALSAEIGVTSIDEECLSTEMENLCPEESCSSPNLDEMAINHPKMHEVGY